eukprot:TRINITY_DN65448_c0_g1_i1.p1 TRINITY_DN65448_c0_g1~~TRINITY_DN65448_c0_g1_i1.p1  ORF type:complete len:322 (+),score=46.05 TRINITY_DN65448_c0_g1_i1:122-1087(+)
MAEQSELMLGIAFSITTWIFFYKTCSCIIDFCRCKRPANQGVADERVVKVEGKEVPVEHLMRHKDMWTAYSLCATMGLFGAHHFYLDRILHGAVAAMTLNFGMLGYFIDLLAIPTYTRNCNLQTVRSARPDASCRRYCCCMPCVGTVALCNLLLFFGAAPLIIQATGLVDIERRMAGTKENPYVILNWDRNVTRQEATRAMPALMDEIHKSKDCVRSKNDKACKVKMSEFKKAFDFVTGEAVGCKKVRAKRNRKDKLKGKARSGKSEWEEFIEDAECKWNHLADALSEGAESMSHNVAEWFQEPEGSSHSEESAAGGRSDL